MADRERRYQQTREIHLSKRQKLNRLKELSRMYALYEPHKAACKESQSLKGFARLKYDKEHKDSLEKRPEMRERMYKLLNEGRQQNKMQSRGKRREEEI